MKLVYPAYFSPLTEQPGYCVTFPDLPGCVTQGKDIADAIYMAIDAASGWILDEIEEQNKLPVPTPLEKIKIEEKGDFVNLVVLDIDAYAEKFGEKAVRKNCTIPAWLNSIAEKSNINFSTVLQEALKKQLGFFN